MEIDSFTVKDGTGFDLSSFKTDETPGYTNKGAAKIDMKQNIKTLRKLQEMFYAHNRHSVLIIFQAMDAAGKDGAIEHVMTGLNPQGTQVFSFKQPSSEELDHDFLWRCSKALPERGRIGIFNRSYYEDVLIVRVHPGILDSKRLPDEIKSDPYIWQKRFRSIRSFEEHLKANGTTVIKFFLHLSKEEQKNRFLRRINRAEKNWKFSTADARERGYWDKYQEVYQDAIQNTSTPDAPWYIIPADHKWFARYAVSEIIAQRFSELEISFPEVTEKHLEDLQNAKAMLESES